MDDEITLISQTNQQDNIGNNEPVETARQVLCCVKNIGRDEFYKAGQQGLAAKYMFITNPVNYNGESIVKYKDNRYSVYRTYRKNADELEIYVKVEEGVSYV